MKCAVQVHESERGVTLVTVAVSLTAMFAMAALAVDLGKLYLERTQLQHAADAAALAGAFSFIDINQTQPTAATNAAIVLANSMKTIAGQVAITSANVTVDTTNRMVTVTVPQPNTGSPLLSLASAIGVTSLTISAHATAQASLAAGGSRCIKPVFIPNSVIRASTDSSSTQACSGTEPHTIFYPATSPHYGELTTYAKSYLPSNVNTEVLIRPTKPSVAAAPGQFYSIDYGSGANTYGCAITSCLNTCGGTNIIACGNSLPLETGNMVGPTLSGFDILIGTPPLDSWVAPGEYQSNSTGQIRDTSSALITAPVFDDCTDPIDSGGGQQPKVIGYVQVFIDKVDHSQNGVYGHILTGNGCAAAGSGTGVPSTSVGSSTATGPFGTPIQLVH